MANKRSTAASTEAPETSEVTEQDSPTTSEPTNVGGPEVMGLISAWDGLYYAFGARVERFDVTSDGIVAVGFTMNTEFVQPDQLIRDLNCRTHKPRLEPTIYWLNGIEPEKFSTDQAWSTWLVQSFKGSVPDGANKAPKYARDAVASLKVTNGTARRRGPKPTTINFKNISAQSLSDIAKTDPNALLKLRNLLENIDLPEEAVASSTN